MSRLPDFASTEAASSVPAAAVLAAALVLGVAVAEAWTARDQATRTGAAVTALRTETAAQRRIIESARSRVRQTSGPALGALTAPAAVILGHLTARLPEDVRLAAFDVQYEDSVRLSLSVEALTPQAWDRFLAALAASPRLRELRPSGERREEGLRVGVTAVWIEGAPR